MPLSHAANLTSAPMRSSGFGIAITLVLLCGCGGGDAGSGGSSFDGEQALKDVRTQVEIGPRPSGSPGAQKEAELIRKRLRSAGIGDVTIQHPYRNVVARISGSRPGVVVVGAHYDTKDIPEFVGANDGASGVAILLGLADALPARMDGSSVDLVFFDAEEARGKREFASDGDRGSRQFVALAKAGGSQGATPLRQMRSMVLFDMVGDCDLEIPHEATSDQSLYDQFADATNDLTGSSAPFEGESAGVGDDHTPFQEAGVPAVDLIDFTYGPGGAPGAYWHTPQDTLDNVCADSLDAVGEAALVAIPRIADG